jgi:hypothetical protein
MKNNYYVYIYFDTRKPGRYVYDNYIFDYEPFYIGKGKDKRYYYHIKESYKKTVHTPNANKIRKIRNITGDNPIIIKIESLLSEEKAFEIEKKFIRLIGRKDLSNGPLLNLTDGGDGFSNIIRKPITPEGRENLSKAMKSAMQGDRNHMYGKKGKENNNYGRGKKIYQYDIFGNLIKVWDNSNLIEGFDRHAIDNRCKNNSEKHYCDFIWSYKSLPDNSFIKLSGIKRLGKGYYSIKFFDGNIMEYKNMDIRKISKILSMPRNLLETYIQKNEIR